MSGEVKFGRVVDRWAVGTTANVPIMAMVRATGPHFEATGEVVSAKNNIRDVGPNAFVHVLDCNGVWHLISAERGPQS